VLAPATPDRIVRLLGVLAPATPDRIVRLLGELAPLVMTGTGPTHEQREPARLPFRKRT
jgi:hypothetical protein